MQSFQARARYTSQGRYIHDYMVVSESLTRKSLQLAPLTCTQAQTTANRKKCKSAQARVRVYKANDLVIFKGAAFVITPFHP